jgi:hypothetical protein
MLVALSDNSPTPADTADITGNILLLGSRSVRSVIAADDAPLRFDSAATADATSLVLFSFRILLR